MNRTLRPAAIDDLNFAPETIVGAVPLRMKWSVTKRTRTHFCSVADQRWKTPYLLSNDFAAKSDVRNVCAAIFRKTMRGRTSASADLLVVFLTFAWYEVFMVGATWVEYVPFVPVVAVATGVPLKLL